MSSHDLAMAGVSIDAISQLLLEFRTTTYIWRSAAAQQKISLKPCKRKHRREEHGSMQHETQWAN